VEAWTVDIIAVVLADRKTIRWQKPAARSAAKAAGSKAGGRHSDAGPPSTFNATGVGATSGSGDTERSSRRDSECQRAGLSTSRLTEQAADEGARAERGAFAKAPRTGLGRFRPLGIGVSSLCLPNQRQERSRRDGLEAKGRGVNRLFTRGSIDSKELQKSSFGGAVGMLRRGSKGSCRGSSVGRSAGCS